MIDCARNGNFGCKGGDTCQLLEWLKFNKVQIETEDEYPVENETNSTCRAKSNQVKYFTVADFTCDK